VPQIGPMVNCHALAEAARAVSARPS
jgi:hypothetical protein